MGALGRLFAEIRSVRDCPAVHNLLIDCWQVAQEKGEAEGLAFARLVLDGVKAFEAHARVVRGFGKWAGEERA